MKDARAIRWRRPTFCRRSGGKMANFNLNCELNLNSIQMKSVWQSFEGDRRGQLVSVRSLILSVLLSQVSTRAIMAIIWPSCPAESSRALLESPRKYVRPQFQANKATRLAYDLINFFVTKLMLTYIVFSFNGNLTALSNCVRFSLRLNQLRSLSPYF